MIVVFCGSDLLLGIIIILLINLSVRAHSSKTHDDISELPHNKIGLVLGCSRYLNSGAENPFFRNRIEAAARLFQAGKVDRLLVSGDNQSRGRNEAADMKQMLRDLRVPAEKILCDEAGFTTLDSVVRCQKVFDQNSFTIISQKFHNERALYLAHGFGIKAVAYNAMDVKPNRALKTYLREIFARIRAVWDVKIIRRQPECLQKFP